MKTRVIRKDIIDNYSNILNLGGACINLLRYETPFAYNAGKYGWNWDAYYINGVILINGYRNMIGERVDWDVLHEYDKRAKEVQDLYMTDNYNVRATKTHEIIIELTEKFKRGDLKC